MTKESKKIYDTLEKEIITLKIKPNDKISENAISAKFGVSRTPIRDVLKMLEFNKLVEVRSQSGCYITKVDISNLNDTIFLRASCEYQVMLSLFNKITDDEVNKLLLITDKQKATIDDYQRSGDIKFADEFFKLDNSLHKEIYKLADYSSLYKFLNNGFPTYQRYRYLTGFRNLKENETLYEIHKNLVISLKKKDPDFLSEKVKEHNYSCLNGIDIVIGRHPDYFITK